MLQRKLLKAHPVDKGAFMRRSIACIVFVSVIALAEAVGAEIIGGSPNQASGDGWQSAYVNLDPPRDFLSGEKLRIRVHGSAEWVRVRLLPTDGKPDSPVGLIGTKMKIPSNEVLEVNVETDHLKVRQISVHAGKLAWGESLNPTGGDVEIVSIEVSAQKAEK